MPARDGTGPMGQGPASGGARGGCLDTGYGMTGWGRGRGGGMGRGRGRGLGRRGMGFGGAVVDEKAVLQARAEQMRQDLAQTERRLAELSREPEPQTAD